MPGTAREAEHGGEHPPPDLLHPRRVRMDPVLLVEQGHGGHPVQQERVEDRPVPGGELRVDRVEPARVLRPEVGGSHHAGEEDGEVPLGEDAEQAVEVRPGHRGVDRAQPVVRPKGDDDRVRVVREGPFDPGEPAGRGIARHPRVDHPRVDPVRAKDGLQPGGERVARREPVAGGEAVPEHEDPQLALDRAHQRRDGGRHQRRNEDRRDRTREPAGSPWTGCGAGPVPARPAAEVSACCPVGKDG